MLHDRDRIFRNLSSPLSPWGEGWGEGVCIRSFGQQPAPSPGAGAIAVMTESAGAAPASPQGERLSPGAWRESCHA